jgi:hypothetical protein
MSYGFLDAVIVVVVVVVGPVTLEASSHTHLFCIGSGIVCFPRLDHVLTV